MPENLLTYLLPGPEHFSLTIYWIAFGAALLETVFGLGLILPGTTVILLLGVLSAGGHLEPGALIWFAVGGAILGDNINYQLGRKFGAARQGRFKLFRPDPFQAARHYLQTRGASALFLGRFRPGLKETIPFVAGAAGVGRLGFMLVNGLGVICWGVLTVLAGYAVGGSLALAALWLSRSGILLALLALIAVILLVLKWLIISQGRQILDTVVSLYRPVQEALLQSTYLQTVQRTHPRSSRFLSARFERTSFTGMPLTAGSLAFIYVMALYAGIIEDFLSSELVVSADVRIVNLFQSLRTETLTRIFSWITLLGDSWVLNGFMLVAGGLLWVRRRKHQVVPLALTFFGSMLFMHLSKLVFQRSRPDAAFYTESTFSFPSGHATLALAFYGFLGYLLISASASWKRQVNWFFFFFALIAAIGLSRIYLGVHFPSDVWSGFLVGLMWVVLGALVLQWLRSKGHQQPKTVPASARPITIGLLAGAVLIYLGIGMFHIPSPSEVGQPDPTVVANPAEIFTAEEMKYTETILGKRQEPLNLLFVAPDQNRLRQTLVQAGWVLADEAEPASLMASIKAVLLRRPYGAAPAFPSFWQARVQDLSMTRAEGDGWRPSAHHVKIWYTQYVLEDGQSIYLGVVHALEGMLWGFVPKVAENLDAARERILSDLRQAGVIESRRKLQLVPPTIGTTFIGSRFSTDGAAYIIDITEKREGEPEGVSVIRR